jgi:hypothetical protein
MAVGGVCTACGVFKPLVIQSRGTRGQSVDMGNGSREGRSNGAKLQSSLVRGIGCRLEPQTIHRVMGDGVSRTRHKHTRLLTYLHLRQHVKDALSPKVTTLIGMIGRSRRSSSIDSLGPSVSWGGFWGLIRQDNVLRKRNLGKAM